MSHSKQTFKPQRRLGMVWLFMAAFGLFALIGLVMVWFDRSPGLIFIGFGFGFMLLTWLNTHTVRAYVLTEQELILQQWFKSKHLKRAAIEHVQAVDQQDIKELLAMIQEKEIQASNQGHWLQAWRARMEAGKLTEYWSMPIVYQETSVGHELAVSAGSVHVNGFGVLIVTKQDDHYLVSPTDIQSFIDSLR